MKMPNPRRAYRMASQPLLDTPKPRTVRVKVVPSPKKKEYKIPKTPKTSGKGWGP